MYRESQGSAWRGHGRRRARRAKRERTGHAVSHHRRSGVHRIAPRRGIARPGRPRSRPRRPVDRVDRQRPPSQEGSALSATRSTRARARRSWPSSSTRPTSSTTSPPRSASTSSSTARCGRSRPTCTARRSCSPRPARRRRPVFIASTSEVYGKSASLPFREDGDFVLGSSNTGRWSYACSKAIDEFLALAYWKERKLPTVVARLFNTVGPRQTGRYGMVVPTLVQQALAGRPLTVYGDGTPDALLLPRRRRRPRARRPHAARRAGLRRGLQHRLAGGDVDPRARRTRRRADRLGLRDPPHPLRGRLRGRLRGHAAPLPRRHEDRRRRSAGRRRGRWTRSSTTSSSSTRPKPRSSELRRRRTPRRPARRPRSSAAGPARTRRSR